MEISDRSPNDNPTRAISTLTRRDPRRPGALLRRYDTAECETDTNNAIYPDYPCTVTLDDLQEDRFEYQTATSNMYVYGTLEALELVGGFQEYFSGNSYTGEWSSRALTGDQSEYYSLYSEFLDQMRTDIDSI